MKAVIREALHNLQELIQIFHLLDEDELEMLLPYFVVEHYAPVISSSKKVRTAASSVLSSPGCLMLRSRQSSRRRN
jgi:hypothetical protein